LQRFGSNCLTQEPVSGESGTLTSSCVPFGIQGEMGSGFPNPGEKVQRSCRNQSTARTTEFGARRRILSATGAANPFLNGVVADYLRRKRVLHQRPYQGADPTHYGPAKKKVQPENLTGVAFLPAYNRRDEVKKGRNENHDPVERAEYPHVAYPCRILSLARLSVWVLSLFGMMLALSICRVITEADRSPTRILLPEDH